MARPRKAGARNKGGWPMKASQEAHLERIKSGFVALVDRKYRAGAAEHGGVLLELSEEVLVDEAIGEAVDQVVYLLSLKELLAGRRS